ncbi:Yippee family zinc-binding protein, putative isoform 2 [Theobroma cacao]|uniref:Yippee family zinc-binding protein, putative isoform 2 n=1 Tax=Theobroma cacao TaxID=3641 RepID=A0A061G2M2_THECC|nr:Yippee family zinc-binding protein, putative isoform 2 [Theobroma cacao]
MLHIDLVQKLVTRLEICHCFPLCILYIAQRPQNARWIDHSHINKLRYCQLLSTTSHCVLWIQHCVNTCG